MCLTINIVYSLVNNDLSNPNADDDFQEGQLGETAIWNTCTPGTHQMEATGIKKATFTILRNACTAIVG